MSENNMYFLIGFFAYTILHFFFYKPLRFYVLCHELTHAISTIISGGKVKSLKIGKDSGKITVTKSNLFVTISPYFIPIIPIFIAVIWFMISIILPGLKEYRGIFYFLFGFFLSFHLLLTIYVISKGQPDLNINSFLYSLTFVIFGNCLIITLFFSLLFSKNISFLQYLEESIKNSLYNYNQIINFIISVLK